MSGYAVAWAMAQESVKDSTTQLVLLVLADAAGGTYGENAFPSISTIARRARLSENTVRDRLRELEGLGLIVRGNQAVAQAYIKRADRCPTVYDMPQVEIFIRAGREALKSTGFKATAPRGDGVQTEAPRASTEQATGCKAAAPDLSQKSVREPQSARARGTAARGASETERWVYLRELASGNGFRPPGDMELQVGPQIYESALRLHLRDVPRGTLTRDAAHFMGYERATA